MKRKIAIIADGWRRHITYVWIRGCRNYIKEHELDIEISVFHSFGNFSRDEKFNAGEYNIIHLPDLSQFDGIILEVTNMLNQKKKQARARCRNAIQYVKQKLNRPVKTDYRKNQLEPSLSGLAKQRCENLENPDPDQPGCSHW